jgi:transport and Golgi organization protein 2
MCTLSFLPTQSGFRIAMNRDEKRVRIAALPPERFAFGDRQVLYPREPGGGTWLAANDAGLCLALINWHRIAREPLERITSRGQIIPQLIGASSSAQLERNLRAVKLQDLRPFRLIAVVPSEHALLEFRWNLRALRVSKQPWRTHHWFSSGFDERQAESTRRVVCDRVEPRTIKDLRTLHRSHVPRRGPFSICMHRRDAKSVSYAEVSVTRRSVVMRYADGSPCAAKLTLTKRLPLKVALGNGLVLRPTHPHRAKQINKYDRC